MKAIALTSAAVLLAMATATHAQIATASDQFWADDPGYEQVNNKQGRIPAFDPQPNTRQFEPEINPKVGAFPVVTPTRATNEGWVEVNAKQGRIPAFDFERQTGRDALAGN